MTALRLLAIGVIFVIAAVAWFALGASVDYRTNWADGRGQYAVEGLWGSAQRQVVPTFTGDSVQLEGSDITADFQLEQRRKGLLWYATYVVDFDASYRLHNDSDSPSKARVSFAFPDPAGVYDGFSIDVDGTEVPVDYQGQAALADIVVPADSTVTVRTGYRTNGVDEWRYDPSPDGVGVIEDFSLGMTTDFEDIDFPDDAVSPTVEQQTAEGWSLGWEYDSLVSGRPIALSMPTPLNPGPVASRISFFAPVSLLFFFAALVLLTTTQGLRVHPMNYGFLAAGFFAFHLLFAYLVDRIDINVAFAIASITSMVLCIGYLRMVVGTGAALRDIAASQFIFLVLFSYSFFFEGLTGLAVTIGSVLTLAYFMAKTGKVDWEQVFKKAPPAWATQPTTAPPVSTDPAR